MIKAVAMFELMDDQSWFRASFNVLIYVYCMSDWRWLDGMASAELVWS